MYLCKYPVELRGQSFAVGETIADDLVDALPINNRIALVNRGWIVKLDDRGQEPGLFKNNFKADWDWTGEKARAAQLAANTKNKRDGAGRLTGDVDDSIIDKQRNEDVALSEEALASLMPGRTLPKLPNFESMESLPPEQRTRIQQGKQVGDVLDLDAQVIDDIEVKSTGVG